MTDRATPEPSEPTATPAPKPPPPPKASDSPPAAPGQEPSKLVPLPPPSLRKRYGTAALLDVRPGVAFPEHASVSEPKPSQGRGGAGSARAVTLSPEDYQTLLPSLTEGQATALRRLADEASAARAKARAARAGKEGGNEDGAQGSHPITLSPDEFHTVFPELDDAEAAELRRLAEEHMARRRAERAARETRVASPAKFVAWVSGWNAREGRVALLAALAVVGLAVFSLTRGDAESTAPARSPARVDSAQQTDSASDAPGSSPGAKASPAALEAARVAGKDALEKLAQAHPEDATVLAALARVLTAAGQHPAAVERAKRALELDPGLAGSDTLATVFWMGAQSSAENATFQLLLAKFGSRGADVIFDLATTPGVKASTQTRAKRTLETSELARLATAEAYIAADLVTARDCATRKALLRRASNVGDARSLRLLEQFRGGKGCAAGETQPCNACLAGSDELTKAIAALGARQRGPVGTPKPHP